MNHAGIINAGTINLHLETFILPADDFVTRYGQFLDDEMLGAAKIIASNQFRILDNNPYFNPANGGTPPSNKMVPAIWLQLEITNIGESKDNAATEDGIRLRNYTPRTRRDSLEQSVLLMTFHPNVKIVEAEIVTLPLIAKYPKQHVQHYFSHGLGQAFCWPEGW